MFASDIGLVGHPFAPIGMGEHIRSSFRSFRSVGLAPALFDIYPMQDHEADTESEVSRFMGSALSPLSIFHINGVEVAETLPEISRRFGDALGYRIIYPLWELPRYPAEWAVELDRFDEIWAPSHFIEQALSAAVHKPVLHMPLSCEVMLSSFVGRRYFGIPEQSFAYLFFFDTRSFASRKNPQAIIAAFRKVLKKRPGAECVLVLKVNGAELDRQVVNALRESLADLGEQLVLICETLTDNEIKNLIRCCDCFVSLHRSEGFGFGLSEAMFLGKPVIATGYSGNMDFTNPDNALLVDYKIVPVPPDSYPHWQNQVWADPDVEQAARHMLTVLDNEDFCHEIGRRGSLHIRTNFGYRATGVRYRERIDAIQRARAKSLEFVAG